MNKWKTKEIIQKFTASFTSTFSREKEDVCVSCVCGHCLPVCRTFSDLETKGDTKLFSSFLKELIIKYKGFYALYKT